MNYSRASGISRFVLLILAIVFVVSVAVCGIYISDDTKLNGIFEEGTIRLGLDLAGGSVVTFQADTEDSGDDLDIGMDSVQTVMRDRLDNQGLTEALCYRVGDDMVTIEIPDVDDPNEVISNYMQTAVLEFRDASGNTVLTGEHVEKATPSYYQADDGTQQICVQLKLTDEGATLFADVTKEAAANGTSVGIYMDGVQISNPTVDSQYATTGITGGEAIISGSFTEMSQASQLAGNINAGALKYTLSVVEQRTVGATLGENSLATSVIAGGIGLLLVIIFMCIYYKVPGVMASVSLVLYTGLFFFLLIITKANLTLAGIAGVVLSIGMAVDANVVIFERIKEEIDIGKSAKSAINGGFKRAFAAILDSNVTTIIACAVLYFLGSGTIKGFATTLFMGVIISLFTALVITKALLNLCVAMGINKPESYRSIGRRAK